MIIEEMEQGSDEWRRARCGVVTASNFRFVLAKGSGKTRKRYLDRVAQEIITGAPEEPVYWNGAMERGIELEPRARQAYAAATGHFVRETGLIFLDGNRRVSASPDGLINDDGGLEIKCPLPHTHAKYLQSGSAPAKYMPQIQGNLWITGRKWWDFASFAPEGKNRIFIRRVYRDDAYIARLKAGVEAFLLELDRMA